MPEVKKIISPENMGIVICEVARVRLEDIWNRLHDNKTVIDYNPILLQIVSFEYTFFIIKLILQEAYDNQTIKKILNSAYTLFYKMTADAFPKFIYNYSFKEFSDMIEMTLLELDQLLDDYPIDSSMRFFQEMSKLFYNEIVSEPIELSKTLPNFQLALEFATQYTHSFYLITDYVVDSPTA